MDFTLNNYIQLNSNLMHQRQCLSIWFKTYHWSTAKYSLDVMQIQAKLINFINNFNINIWNLKARIETTQVVFNDGRRKYFLTTTIDYDLFSMSTEVPDLYIGRTATFHLPAGENYEILSADI